MLDEVKEGDPTRRSRKRHSRSKKSSSSSENGYLRDCPQQLLQDD